MSWLEALTEQLGTGSGGAAIAAAIYAGGIALESEMRADAKKEIAALINAPRLAPDVRTVSRFICETFDLIFGKRHWSWKCFIRSVLASWLFVLSIFLIICLKYRSFVDDAAKQSWELISALPPSLQISAIFIVILLNMTLLSCLPDYLSLYKSRVLLRYLNATVTWRRLIFLVVLDLILSFSVYALASLLVWRYLVGATVEEFTQTAFVRMSDYYRIVTGTHPQDRFSIISLIMALSTMMTSLWTILIIVSSLVLKAIGSFSRVMRLASWMFDVDAHPIRVLGLVAATICWVGSVIYSFI